MLPQADPTVVYRALPDGSVLFSPNSERYFGLNVTATCVWENLAPVNHSVEAVCDELARRFPDVETRRIRLEVESLLSVLEANGLVLPVSPAP